MSTGAQGIAGADESLPPSGRAAKTAGASATAPFAPFEWALAMRYLRGRKARFLPSVIAAISFVAIMVAVATLIVVMSVMNGFHIELMNKIIGVNGHMFLQSIGTTVKDYDPLVAKLSKVEGITHIFPVVEGAAGVSTRVKQGGALVRGVHEKDIKLLPGIGKSLLQGTFDGFDKSGGVAIGKEMAAQHGVQVGDEITILTARGEETPFGMTPRIRTYPVTAIFHIGVSNFDEVFVYMPLEEAQSFFNLDGTVSLLEAFVKNPEDMDTVRNRLDKALAEPMMVVDWRQRNKSFFDALQVERTVMFLILTLIIIVATLSIVSGLTMLVKDKGRAIAILRTMGATRGAVMRVFLLTGTLIGLAGTIAGLLLGILIAHNLEAIRQFLNAAFSLNLFPAKQYFLSRLPSVMVPGDVAKVVALALVLSILATVYPSWRAARLDPVDALRYE
ncbi:MAG: lipoprotein-releasing ABC transporter permease subunit [Beijerinckiaceae bacterium]